MSTDGKSETRNAQPRQSTKALTEKRIRDAAPDEKPYILWDARVKGLGLKVQPGGTKSFVLDYRAGGRQRRVSLARCSEITLADARARAGRELAAIRDGEPDPLQRREEAREAPTVAEGLDRFFDEFVPERIALGRLSERTAREYRKQAELTIRPGLGGKRIADVTARDIELAVKPRAPINRNRTLALLSRLFNQFERWGWRPQQSNPVRGIERAREEPRDRVLAPREIAALAAALETRAEECPPAAAAVRLAALTGLRIGEVLNIRWEDIDFEGCALTLPTSKTGRRVQALSAPALALLADRPRIADFVFTLGRGAIGYKTARTFFSRVAGDAGLDDIRLHDLRRTVMTNAAIEGVGSHVLRDMLGHKTTVMADRYIRSTGAALRDAVERSGSSMAAMLEGKPPAEVVPLRKR